MGDCVQNRRNFRAVTGIWTAFKQNAPVNQVNMSTFHMQSVSMDTVAISTLHLRANTPELLCKRIAQCLKDVFAQRCTFKTPTNSALSGVKQTKKHVSLIPEFHHIAKSKPADKPSKLLTSPIPGGCDAESCKYGVYHSPQQFIKLAQNLVHPISSL